MPNLRRVLLLPLILALLLPMAAFAAEDPAQAYKDIEELETYIKKKKRTSPDDFGPYLDAVRKAFHNFTVPAKPADDAAPDDLKAWTAEVKKLEKSQDKFDKRALKALFKCVKLVHTDRSGNTNLLDEVNVKSAQLIGDLATVVDDEAKSAITKKLIKVVEGLEKAKYQVRSDHLEELFAALAKHNQMGALSWMAENFTHSKNQDKEVVRLIAAHKAMVKFKDVPGKTRYVVCKEMIKTYSGVESQAETSSTEPAIQAKKAFWDRVRVDAIKVVQYYGGEPKDEEDQIINSMGGFQKWWRDVKNAKNKVWKDEKIKAD